MARKKAPAKTEVETETPETEDTQPAASEDTPPVADDTDPADSDSIDLPEPPRDDTPDTSTTVAMDDDGLEIEGEREDTPADITPDDYDAENPTDAVAPTPAPEAKRGGFFPMVLGGIIAAAIGFAAALGLGGQIPGLGGASDLSDQVAAQDQALADLKASLPAASDLDGTIAAAETNTNAIAELSDRIEGVAGQLTELATRVTELENAPMSDSVSDDARAAYEEELAKLQEAMRQQREEVESMVAKAEDIRDSAAARSSETQARAAVTEIIAALNNGDGYAEALDLLAETGTQIPDPLSANVEGVPTLANLRDSFPEAARRALAVTRGAGNGSVSDFFKTQLGVRSLSPKDGNDPDAILSRAEAAVATGDIPTALTEIEALPPEAMAELSDWKSAAETRLVTVEAAEGLMTELNSN